MNLEAYALKLKPETLNPKPGNLPKDPAPPWAAGGRQGREQGRPGQSRPGQARHTVGREGRAGQAQGRADTAHRDAAPVWLPTELLVFAAARVFEYDISEL